MKTPLCEMTLEELSGIMKEMGEPAFRAGQIFSRAQAGERIPEMTSLPLRLRQVLSERFEDRPVEVLERVTSKLDGTVKLLYRLTDGHVIEGVVMRYRYGNTLCLSTQVGCRMGCRFCASTLEGCARNLSAGEMLGQVHCANAQLEAGARISRLVLMGSGEPLDNYDAVVRFLRLVNDPAGLNVGIRNISLSTCGLVPRMHRFAEEGLPLTLSVSLHAPNDRIRRQIMPVADAYSVSEVLDACRCYIRKTGRRVIFEYALIHGINAAPEQARELAALLRGVQCHVNLIPLNSVPERGLTGVSEAEVTAFRKTLEGLGISVTRRREMGDDIEGACGQLRRRYLQGAQARQTDS